MAGTTFVERERGTWSRHLHRYNGYRSGFSTPGNGVLRSSTEISGPALASANPLSARSQGTAGPSHGAAA